MASGGDARERLKDIWTAWGLKPSETLGDVQLKALSAVEAWLSSGAENPEIACRGIQILLADPERPGWMKRPSWTALRGVLNDVWSNSGTGEDHLMFAQALLLAAWPTGSPKGWLGILPLFDSAWGVTVGRTRQKTELTAWRDGLSPTGLRLQASKPAPTRPTMPAIAPRGGVDFSSVATIAAGLGTTVAPAQLVQVLDAHREAIELLGTSLYQLSTNMSGHWAAEAERAADASGARHDQLEYLWWGQARYSNTLRKAYRNMADVDDVLWWTSWEAALLSASLDVEPAAAYLVETLHGLGHDVFEKRSLRDWMGRLHGTLGRVGEKAPAVSTILGQLAGEDPLGLPVTWVRTMTGKDLANASDAVGLNLEVEVDRGGWASWIFRESLLDLRLTRST